MLLIDYSVDSTDTMADYTASISNAHRETGREILAAPVGLEHGVVQLLRSGGLAVRCVTLDELQQIRDQQEITVFCA